MKRYTLKNSWPHHSLLARIFVLALMISLTAGSMALVQIHTTEAASNHNKPPKPDFQFSMIQSPNINQCLPQASGFVSITRGQQNDIMHVSVRHLVPNTGYDLFVIEIPNKPFGVAWYQSDLETDKYGNGDVTVEGIFNRETFSISTGGPTVTFPATHQFHLGLWFNDPQVPFVRGCEPGQTSPIVTPFNGEQNAGIQVLNTANFSDAAGPLSFVNP
ncbi:hypothetical protein [Dictyobacter kobayashii]|uniref:Uncharacterized protein n=1 Tax=Dictyobacter kobayashii TaxID=2014872 RepID=A0A402AYA7_9CHLR|nr:hypothetical protein [Dictyobacter kobayashii]GCE24065.1 hypothetical protein KDK_78650 [Dictyobacter kobayashii]